LVRRCHEQFGDIFTVRINGRAGNPYVFVSDPAAVKAIATGDRDALRAGAARGFDLFEPVFGPTSILLLDGATHLRQRKLMLPPFHGERMKSYGDLITAETERRMADWQGDKPFELQEEFQHVTLDVILQAVFGFDSGPALDRARKRIQRWLKMLASPAAMVPFLRNNFGPVKPWSPLARMRDRVDEALYELIAERRADPGVAERDDVLSMLIGARDENGEPMTDQEIRDQLLTLLVAGHETTANALAWAFERLVHQPEVLERLTGELAKGGEDYLEAVTKETLRLRPVLPIVARKLTQTVRLEGFRYPPGTVLMPCVFLVHHNPRVYDDPEAFRPERFLGRDAPATYAWIPFGGGVRRCLGASFALVEMQVVLRTILSRVELRAPGRRSEPIARRSFTFSPRRAGRVVVTRRLPAAA
jgi:cytochrome P450